MATRSLTISRNLLLIPLLAGALVACGGGSSSGPASSTTPLTSEKSAPAGLTYPVTEKYKLGTPIASITPTVTGTVDSYSVSPALPAGLSLNSTTGAISGTPTAVTAAASYTFTATNSMGSATATITIEVDDAPPQIAYQSSHYVLTDGTATNKLLPLSFAGAVTSWSVSPALPAGLTFGVTDGSISGTASAAAAAATYTVTANNSGGSTTFALKLAVSAVALPDLGHTGQLFSLRDNGSQLFSLDRNSHWNLWDPQGGKNMASGDSTCTADTCGAAAECLGNSAICASNVIADMKGGTVAVEMPQGFELLAAADGHLLATISSVNPAWWRLAADGSYVVAGSSTGLMAWSVGGQILVAKSGDYSVANTYAAASQIQVAGGAQGPATVETINISTGASTVSPAFNGLFYSWFADGQHFLTRVENTDTALLYTSAAAQAGALTASAGDGLGGTGNWLWDYDGSGRVNFYSLTNLTTAASVINAGLDAPVIASGNTIGILETGGNGAVVIVDVSGSVLTTTNATTSLLYPSAYAATSTSSWFVGDNAGALLDGSSLAAATPRFLDYGAVLSMAGSNTRVAMATATGRILDFDGMTGALEGTIEQYSSDIQLTADGSVLAAGNAAAGTTHDSTLNIYSLAAGGVDTLQKSWTYPNPIELAQEGFTLSASGTVLIQDLGLASYPGSVQATAPTASTVLWTATPERLAFPSPDGSHAALKSVPSGAPLTFPGPSDVGWDIYSNGTLVTSVSGSIVGWLDNNHLLANTYTSSPGGLTGIFSTVVVYDVSGNLVTNSPLGGEIQTTQAPDKPYFQSIVSNDTSWTADTIYIPAMGRIVQPSTGKVLFSGAEGTVSAAGSSLIFFVSGSSQLAALPH